MKEYKLIINTEEGQTSFKTDIFEGLKLDAIVLDSNEKYEIIIESELGYLIFHRHELIGVDYISIRNRNTTPIEKLTDYLGYEKFLLNESLIITVRGRKNQEIKLSFRFDD